MKQTKELKTGTSRRTFISNGGLWAGTVLASSSATEVEARARKFMPASPEPPQELATLREDLVTANHILFDQGVVDGDGDGWRWR